MSFFITPYPDEVTVNMTRVPTSIRSTPTISRARRSRPARKRCGWSRFSRARAGFRNARIAATATQIGVRESRRIAGVYTLTRDDIVAGRTFDDAVARSAYPIDIHNPSGSGTTTHRLPAGTSYEIPYRCLVPRAVDGLLVAGRCISTTHEALASTRLTPTVMTLGQAAAPRGAGIGIGVAPRAVAARALRERLIAAGVDLRRASAAGA